MDMYRRVSTNFAVMSILIDFAAVAFSVFFIAYLGPLPSSQNGLFYLSISIIWPAVFLLIAVYDHPFQLEQFHLWARLLFGNLLASAFLTVMLITAGAERYDPFFPWFFVIIILATVAWRLVFAVFAKVIGPARWVHPLLIVGTDHKARDLFNGLRCRPELGFVPLGLVATGDQDAGSSQETLGGLHDLPRLIQVYSIRDLVVALPPNEKFPIDSILMELGGLPVQVWAFPDFLEAAIDSKHSEQRLDWPFTQLSSSALSGRQRLVKRSFDLGVSCLLLPFSLIATGIIALAIRLEVQGRFFSVRYALAKTENCLSCLNCERCFHMQKHIVIWLNITTNMEI